MFSVIWPLTGLCAFLNNWVELRSDAAKISYNARRPIPLRTDTIGPWIDNLNIISWFSSLTNASILYLFHGTTDSTPRLGLSMLLLCILVSEHGYLALRSFAGLILDSFPTEAELDVRKKKYSVKSSWLSRLSSAIGVQSSELLGRGSPDMTHLDPAFSAQLENDLGVEIIRSSFKSN